MTKLTLHQDTTLQSIGIATADNSISSACYDARTARERFLAQHGPTAQMVRRPTVPKELRKALIAAEMARWECF